MISILSAITGLFTKSVRAASAPRAAAGADGPLKLPILTNYTAKDIATKETVDMVGVSLSDGNHFAISANTLPTDSGLPELRAMLEFAKEKSIKNIKGLASLTSTAKDDYDTAEVNESSLKVTGVSI